MYDLSWGDGGEGGGVVGGRGEVDNFDQSDHSLSLVSIRDSLNPRPPDP